MIEAKRHEESKWREVEGVDWRVQFDSVLALTFRWLLCSRGCLRWYALCHRRLDSIEVQGSVVVREQQRYDVEPDPEYEGCYKSQGYDYVSELDHDVGREVVDFEGHKRVVRVPR